MSVTETSGGEARSRTPVHLWIVGVLALLWNAMGAFDYLATQLRLESYMSQFTEQQLAYFYGIPAWAVAGWAFGVWGAVAGSIGLLLRKKWSVWAFGISLAGIVVSSIYNFVLSNGAEIMGSGGVFFSAFIFAVAIFFFVYASVMSKRSVLG